MAELFDTRVRALRRDRAARQGPELFLFERSFEELLERLALVDRVFTNALLLGCPDPGWRTRLAGCADIVDVLDPGAIFALEANGRIVMEDSLQLPEGRYDLVLAAGTLDTVNDLPSALRLIRRGMARNGLLLGALAGGDTLPQLRSALRAADSVTGIAVPHAHPRIEASALAPLVLAAGFLDPVVDIDRVQVSYASLERLIGDLRRMAATNILLSRPRFFNRTARAAAIGAFAAAGQNGRTVETFEILHFAAWTG